MPKQEEKYKTGFNLIGQDLQLKDDLSEEKDWYVLLNVLVICVVIAISALAFLFKLNLKASDNKKSQALIKKINTELNVPYKETVKSKIARAEDQVSIYDEFLNQNFDVNKFYDELKHMYSDADNISVEQFMVSPDASRVTVRVSILKNGYIELPQFISTLKKNDRFKDAVIKSVSYEAGEAGNEYSSPPLVFVLDKSDKFITRLEIEVSKSKPEVIEQQSTNGE